MEVQGKKPTNRTQWVLKKLQFLTPHVATRASISNIDLVSMHNKFHVVISYNILYKNKTV